MPRPVPIAKLRAELEKARSSIGRAQTRGARDRLLIKIANYQATIKAREEAEKFGKSPKKNKNKEV